MTWPILLHSSLSFHFTQTFSPLCARSTLPTYSCDKIIVVILAHHIGHTTFVFIYSSVSLPVTVWSPSLVRVLLYCSVTLFEYLLLPVSTVDCSHEKWVCYGEFCASARSVDLVWDEH